MSRATVFALALPLSALAAPAHAQAQAQAITAAPAGDTLLQVAATGEAYAIPDRATISAGVTTIAASAAEAAATNSTKMQGLIAALRNAGVANADMQTSMVSLAPNQTWDQTTGPRITGYTASNQLTIALHDPGKASKIITAAFGGGANDVHGPNFSLSNASGAIAAARADAVRNARQQAQAYADAFGMKISRVLRVSERGQQADYQVIEVTAERAGGDIPPPPPPPPPPPRAPVQSGQIHQTISLWVDFALEPR